MAQVAFTTFIDGEHGDSSKYKAYGGGSSLSGPYWDFGDKNISPLERQPGYFRVQVYWTGATQVWIRKGPSPFMRNTILSP